MREKKPSYTQYVLTAIGRSQWDAVSEVIILDKQERVQSTQQMTEEEIENNETFKKLLHNRREGNVTDETIEFLKRRTLGSEEQAFDIHSIDWQNACFIVKRNDIRLYINYHVLKRL